MIVRKSWLGSAKVATPNVAWWGDKSYLIPEKKNENDNAVCLRKNGFIYGAMNH